MTVRPLNRRESRAWRGFQRMRAELTAHLARELARESGLSEAEYGVLVEVSEAPGRRMRSRDLGSRLGWERSRLSHQSRAWKPAAPCIEPHAQMTRVAST